jgi:hypothetical protein
MTTRYIYTTRNDTLKSIANKVFQLSSSNSRLETAGPVSTGPFIA